MKKSEKIFLVFIALFFIGLFFFITVRDNALRKDGTFTLGVVEDITSSKSGQIYSAHYFFHGVSYSLSFSGIGNRFKKGDLIFIRVSSSQPSIYFNILDYLRIKVPPCLTIKNLPLEGWNELPLSECN